MTTRIRWSPDGGARLFRAGGSRPDDVAPLIWILARSLRLARVIEPAAEIATDDDVRLFLETAVREKTSAEVLSDLGISRQTLHHWRQRAARPS